METLQNTEMIENMITPKEMALAAQNALEEKYNEPFEIVETYMQKLLEDYYMVLAYAKAFPELLFRADVDVLTGTVTDTYVMRRICARISEIISENLSKIKEDCFVYTQALFPYTLVDDPSMEPAAYAGLFPGNQFMVFLCVKVDSVEDIHRDVIVSESENTSQSLHFLQSVDFFCGLEVLKGTLKVYVTDDRLQRKIIDYVSKNVAVYDDFYEMTEDAFRGEFAFEKGILQV